jgi:hypothetical protein
MMYYRLSRVFVCETCWRCRCRPLWSEQVATCSCEMVVTCWGEDDKGVILSAACRVTRVCMYCMSCNACLCVCRVSASRGVRHAAKTRRARWSNSLPQSQDSSPRHQPRGLSWRSDRDLVRHSSGLCCGRLAMSLVDRAREAASVYVRMKLSAYQVACCKLCKPDANRRK